MQKKTDELLKLLFSLHRKGIKPGLERTKKLAKLVNNPQDSFDSIHIAGTNGKGSTSSMIASILIEAGFKVGLYTSPHIHKFNERIQINGQMISDEDIVKYVEPMLEYADEYNFTFFEITTILAFVYFKENEVDFAVIETGMGGQFDSTNIITPLVCGITRIDLDHSEFLGDNIFKIAKEKAGIIKLGVPVVVAKNNHDVVLIMEQFADKLKSPIVVNNYLDAQLVLMQENLDTYGYIQTIDEKINKLTKFLINLPGTNQIHNAHTALNIIAILKSNYNFKISNKNIKLGLMNVKKNTNLKYRIEIINKEPLIIVDVSHNPNGIDNLLSVIKESPYHHLKWNVLFSCLDDKNSNEMLEKLSKITNKLSLVQLKNERATPLQTLISNCGEIFDNFYAYEDINFAVRQLILEQEPLIVVGSFYLVEEFIEAYSYYKSKT